MERNSTDSAANLQRRQLYQAQNLFARLTATYAASRKQGQNILRKAAGLSIVEWRVLWDLSEIGPVTVRELADIQRTDHSQLSRALPEMRHKGYVTMRKNTHDGRQTIVELTESGRAAYERAAPSMKNRRDALNEIFTREELEQFVEFLDRFDEFFLKNPAEKFVFAEETA